MDAHNDPVSKRIAAALVAIALVGLVSCSSDGTESSKTSVENAGPIMITNEDVSYPIPAGQPWDDNSAQRIVTLATGSGEIVTALGGADRIVGRDETSNAPEIESVPVVTAAHAVNAEQVIALNPDVVLVDSSTSPPEAIAQIKDSGITVVEIPEAWSRIETVEKVQSIGAAIGAPTNSVVYVKDQALGRAAELPQTNHRVAFLYLRGTSAIYLVGGVGSGADSLIADSGALDVGAEAGLEAFTPMTAEELVNLNPDTILVMTEGLESVGGVDGLFSLPGLAQTEAAQTRHVVAVDDTLLLSFGARTGALLAALNSAWQQLK